MERDPLTFTIDHRGCFVATKKPSGEYPLVYVKGKNQRANRYVWETTYGPIPIGMCVCHSCDNRMCVNPEHLFLGTHADNQRDKAEKKRSCWGERNGSNRISQEVARKILEASGVQEEIAKRFGVSQPLVSKIKQGVVWKCLRDARGDER